MNALWLTNKQTNERVSRTFRSFCLILKYISILMIICRYNFFFFWTKFTASDLKSRITYVKSRATNTICDYRLTLLAYVVSLIQCNFSYFFIWRISTKFAKNVLNCVITYIENAVTFICGSFTPFIKKAVTDIKIYTEKPFKGLFRQKFKDRYDSRNTNILHKKTLVIKFF